MKSLLKIGAVTYNASEWTLPTDRTFREAWAASSPDVGVISVDIDVAKEIWREKIRAARIEPLAALDAAFMKALETGADTSSIVAQKQALRDAPADARIGAATTPAELIAVQPIPNITVE
jgi:hypothetical protein